ncbi:MAG: MFS transporter [Lachnospiraceae bacterium]|nr:MFS transporter [Lachnospiraceae bacterium]MDY6309204.1 MFS transporter [Oribacterium sp.]
MSREPRRATASEIFRYAFGGLGSNVAYILMMSYLTYYMTDVFGISAYAISGLMLAARIIDAVTDPMMGMIADRTRSKLGRFRPYLIFGAPVLGFTIYLLFCSPNIPESGKVFYAYLMYILYSLASTVCNIPYHALTPVMTDDAAQRTTVVTAKQSMSVPSSLFVGVLALPMVSFFGDGVVGWRRYGLFVAVITVVAFWICAWGARKKDTMDVVPETEKKIPFLTQLSLIFHNKPLLMLLIAFSTDQLAGAAASAVNVYYFQYYLGRKDLVAPVAMIGVVVNIAVFFLIPFLSKRAGKKRLYMTSTVLVCIPYTILYFLPQNDLVLIITLISVSGGLATITGTLGWAMLPDCVEYGEWRTGVRGEGTISSSLTFANKLGMAIGGSLTGIILGYFGYAAGQEQTVQTLEAIKAMKFLFPVAGYICSIVSMSFYVITEKYYAQIMDDLSKGIHADKSTLKP